MEVAAECLTILKDQVTKQGWAYSILWIPFPCCLPNAHRRILVLVVEIQGEQGCLAEAPDIVHEGGGIRGSCGGFTTIGGLCISCRNSQSRCEA